MLEDAARYIRRVQIKIERAELSASEATRLAMERLADDPERCWPLGAIDTSVLRRLEIGGFLGRHRAA